MVEVIPDAAFQQVCQTETCENAEACEAACGIQTKCRKFTICGSISVDEEVNFFERERSEEESGAESSKKSCCVTNNASNAGCACGGAAPVPGNEGGASVSAAPGAAIGAAESATH